MAMNLLLFFFFSIVAEGRVFDLQSERLAPYFRGSAGLSELKQDAYAKSSGTSTLFSEEPEFFYGAEVGLYFSSKVVGLSLGIEFLSSQKLSTNGVDSSGTELMTLESNIRGSIFKMGLTWHYSTVKNQRAYISTNAGYASLKMNNTYELTAAGITEYGLSSVEERATANGIMGEILFGYEFHFADVTTMTFEGGYRYLQVDDWKYQKGSGGFVGGTGVVKNHDGTNRATDLGGAVLGIGFRFYID